MFVDKTIIQLNHLYRILLPNTLACINYKPYIYINKGTVDVYGSGCLTQPTQLSDMTLEQENTAVDGFDTFDCIPEYVCVKQNTGESTEIVVAGLKVTDLGELS